MLEQIMPNIEEQLKIVEGLENLEEARAAEEFENRLKEWKNSLPVPTKEEKEKLVESLENLEEAEATQEFIKRYKEFIKNK